MYLQAVCIDHLGTTAHRREIEPRFSFFDEVLHLAPATVKLNDLIWSCFHRCDDKGIQMDHLVIGFLNLKDNPSRMRPTAGLIFKLAVFHSVINLVFTSSPVKVFIRIGCILD